MYNKISDIDLSSCADILNQMLKENYSVDVKNGFYYNGNNLIARTVPLGNTNEYEYKELTGDIVTFNDAVPDKNIKKLEVEINPAQDLHGYDYPWAGGAGKNLLLNKETATINQVTFTLESDGGYTLSGTAKGNAAFDIGRDVFSLPAGTYTLTIRGNSNAECSLFKIVEGTATYVQGGNSTFAIAETASLFVRLLISSGTAASGTAYVQIEKGTTSTTYEPYANICPISGWEAIHVYHSGADTSNPETVTVQIPTSPGTVYGGTLNVTSGELVVTWVSSNLYDLTWVQSSPNHTIFRSSPPNMKIPTTGPDRQIGFITSNYKISSNPSISDNSMEDFSALRYNGFLFIKNSEYTDDVISFKETLKNQSVCYELAEPQTYHLTPQEVKTLLGTNTIWADSGDVSIKYLAKI